ncbi:hypothetical protein FACS1894127_3310 [Clostridia bacterium]|nr:hypothetical protein FACS1894127_3310 [Clostridia bacterium]
MKDISPKKKFNKKFISFVLSALLLQGSWVSAASPLASSDSESASNITESDSITGNVPEELKNLTEDQLELFSGDISVPHEGYLVSFKSGDRDDQGGNYATGFSLHSILEQEDIEVETISDGLYMVSDLDQAFELADMGELDFIQPNYYYHILGDEISAEVDDPRYPDQWALKKSPGINASSGWKLGLRGRGSKIAVVDTGVESHEDLSGAAIKKYNVIDSSQTAPDTDNGSNNGHGTFVTGVIAAQTNNNLGVASIADKSEILVIKVMSGGKGTSANLVKAINKAMDEDMDVINMSLGTTDPAIDITLKNAVDKAASQGIIMVAAVGNSNVSNGETGKKWESYPAKSENVIGVGSIGESGAVADSSQRNNVTVVAPGNVVLGLNHTGGYKRSSGTSYAAPIVSAMAGISKSVSKSITKAGFETLLKISSDNPITPGAYSVDTGYGRVDMTKFTDYLTTRYAIVYHMQGGTTASPDHFYLSNDDVTLLPAQRIGYTFLGWYEEADYTGTPVEKIAKGSVLSREYYAKWLKNPAITPGNENQTGSATPASILGTVAAVPYSANISTWFEGEDGNTLSYGITSSNGSGVGNISGNVLSYTPDKADAGKKITLKIRAGYLGINSDSVNIDIMVGNVPTDKPPIITPGKENQIGSATPASSLGTVAAVPYSANISTWFEVEAGRTLNFSISSNNGAGVGNISGNVLSYTPDKTDAGKIVTLKIRAEYLGINSEGSVNVDIMVVNVPLDKPPIVTPGKENQTGSATPASSLGTVAAVPYSANISTWFEVEAGRTLNFSISSNNGAGVGNISGNVLSYTPDKADAGKKVTLKIRAEYLGINSEGSVNVDIMVVNVPLDKPPIVTPGKENQTGSATPASILGTVAAVPYSANISTWFEVDAGRTLSYSISSNNGAGVGNISGNVLSYTPDKADAGKKVTLKIRVEYLGISSADSVNVDIMVGNVPSDKSTGNNAGGTGGGGGGAGGGGGGGLSVSQSTNPPTPKPGTGAGITAAGILENTNEPMLISLSTEESPKVNEIFADMKSGSWYYDAVQFVHDKGYFKGTAANLFSPDSVMTRGMFITSLGRFSGVKEADYMDGTDIFTDITVGDWFTPYIAWGYGKNVVQGLGYGRFGAMEPVTREQMAVMVYNYMSSEGYVTQEAVSTLNYGDAALVADWAVIALAWMAEKGILQGKPGGLLDPKGLATRAETAVIFQRIDVFRG